MELAPETMSELQNAAGFGFHYGLHDELAIAIQDGTIASLCMSIPIYLMSRLM
jgi:hypothetical protein